MRCRVTWCHCTSRANYIPKEHATVACKLGIVLDQKLNWNAHIATVKAKTQSLRHFISALAKSTYGISMLNQRQIDKGANTTLTYI